MQNVPVNNFLVMLGRSNRFLGINSFFVCFFVVFCCCFFFFFGGGGGKYVLLKDNTATRVGLDPRPLDPESEVLNDYMEGSVSVTIK